MDPRSLARALGYGRIALGAGLLVAPNTVAGLWVGRDGRRPAARVLATGFGARDLALGVGTVLALSRGQEVAPWVRAGMAADAADLLATWRARRSLPTLAAVGVSAMAGGATVLSAWLQQALD
jgi:hypothetical protein